MILQDSGYVDTQLASLRKIIPDLGSMIGTLSTHIMLALMADPKVTVFGSTTAVYCLLGRFVKVMRIAVLPTSCLWTSKGCMQRMGSN